MSFDIFLAQYDNNKILLNCVTSKELENVVVETAPSVERYPGTLLQAALQIIGHFD